MSIKALMEKKNELITRADEIVNKAEAETRELTDAEAQELAEIRDDVRRIKEHLGLLKDVKELDREGDKNKVEVEPDGDVEVEAREERAFEQYIRGEVLNQRADVTPLSKANNGAVIPETIAKRIIRKLYDICPILEKSTKYNIKGTLAIPYYDESTNAITVGYQSEFTQITASSGTFTTIELGDFLAGALSLISVQLINNVDFPIVDYVVEQMAYSMRRWIEGELLNGTTSKITGLSGATQIVTAASATAVTADELIGLQDAVKDMFQDGAGWIMSPQTRTAIRQLKDDMGRYLLQDDISLPFGKSLLGKPVYVSDNMPEMEAGKIAIYYGNFSGLATKFSKDMEIKVMRERYADQFAVGVMGYFQLDAKIENQQKIAALKMASA